MTCTLVIYHVILCFNFRFCKSTEKSSRSRQLLLPLQKCKFKIGHLMALARLLHPLWTCLSLNLLFKKFFEMYNIKHESCLFDTSNLIFYNNKRNKTKKMNIFWYFFHWILTRIFYEWRHKFNKLFLKNWPSWHLFHLFLVFFKQAFLQQINVKLSIQ